VDSTDSLKESILRNFFSSYLPLNEIISLLSTIIKDHNYIVLCNSSVFVTEPQIMATLSRWNKENNFQLFSFGNSNCPGISNLGPLINMPDFFQHRLLPLFDTIETLTNSTLIIITDPLSIPTKNIYDSATYFSIKTKVLLVAKEIRDIYKYSTLILST
jgi:hypothetical protein